MGATVPVGVRLHPRLLWRNNMLGVPLSNLESYEGIIGRARIVELSADFVDPTLTDGTENKDLELQDKSSDMIDISMVDTEVTCVRPDSDFSIATLLELAITSWGNPPVVVSGKSSDGTFSLSSVDGSETISCLGEETGVNRARSGACSSWEEWRPSIEE